MPAPFDNHQASLTLTQLVPLIGIYPSHDSYTSGIPLGSLRTFAGSFAPQGAAAAEGQLLAIAQNQALFSLFGTSYGGDGRTTFALPNLDGRTMIGEGQGPGLDPQVLGAPIGSDIVTLTTAQLPISVGGSNQSFDNDQPSLPLTYLIRTAGVFPSADGGTGGVEFIGEIVPFAGNFAPGGFMEAAGQILNIASNTVLFTLIGTTYGGDGVITFALPDLRGRTIIGTSAQTPIGMVLGQEHTTISTANFPVSIGGGGQTVDNHEPSLALTYLIALAGIYPPQNIGAANAAADPETPYLGEVVAFAGNFIPKGWAQAAGQLLPISENTALFSLLGTTYGGDGQTTFALPDLRDHTAIGSGTSAVVGETLGTNSFALSTANIPDMQIAGTSGADTLHGADGNDLLNGLGGADTMIGGLGNDSYFVDNASDTAVENANAGTDTIYTTISFTLPANVEVLVLQGNADLQGYGNTLANTLFGNSGNNLLNGGGGADGMFGGAGNDTYFVDNTGDAAIENANEGNDSVFSTVNFTLSANVESLILQGSADLQGYGNSLANTIYGNTGNNLLNGNGGIDLMVGGAGNDVYFADNSSDSCFEVANQGNDSVFASTSYGLAADVENLILQGTGDFQAYGNNQANTIYGNTSNNLLNGGGGIDLMAGGAGNDTYFVDDPSDSCFELAGQGNDAVFATCNYGLAADVETLILQGAADLQGYGNNTANTIYGNAGNNLLNGGGGADTMVGGAGNDVYFVDNAGDGIIENLNEGNDSVFAGASYVLGANIEGLVLQGAANLDGFGNALANSLNGNTGNNKLDGGGAADQLTGNAGNDTFVFNAGQGNGDVVVDFAGNGAAAGDLLNFVGYGAGASFTHIGATNQWQVNYNGGASHDIITFSNGAPIDGTDFSFI